MKGNTSFPPFDTVLVPPFPAIRVIPFRPKLRNKDGEAERDSKGSVKWGAWGWFTLDNRRLCALQFAAATRWPRRCAVAVRCLNGGGPRFQLRKFRTTTEGRAIEIRDRTGERQEWSWQQIAASDASFPE